MIGGIKNTSLGTQLQLVQFKIIAYWTADEMQLETQTTELPAY